MNEDFTRVVTYIHKEKYKQLKSILALRGLSVSEWVRRLVDKIIEGK